ncbi:unnamed protein product [Echinostoma caproni]|uniref:Uncharacterized protein n=1 Tax=Echinostoma caproni TaxID=27848 RepID=A0A183ARC5_9TREM|nr:unnamed protein product [Echinostoma caproni]
MRPIRGFHQISHYAQESIIPAGLTTREFHSSNNRDLADGSLRIPKFAERAGHGLILNQPPLEYLGLHPNGGIELQLPLKRNYIKPALKRVAQPHLYLRQFIQYPVLDEANRKR